MTVPPAESFRAVWADANSLVGSGTSGRGFSSNAVHHNQLSRSAIEDIIPFLASDNSTLVRLPPADSMSPQFDPVGHIVCVIKTKTKSNQSNDRVKGDASLDPMDGISAQNVRILLQGGDGKGQMVITPSSMGAMKLTKADAGRSLDAAAKDKKIQSWVKDCYDRRIAPFDPSLTNVLQFDISTTEAEKLASQFQPGQSMRIKVKFPWLCDTDCAMTEPISKTWIDKISSSTSRVSICLMPEICRLLPTVNK